MMPAWIRAAVCSIAACCVLASCDRTPQSDRALAEQDAATDSIAGDSLFVAPTEQQRLPSDRIYYTLTTHEWYARGEPLIHGDRPYQPVGMPVEASLDEMRRAGEFQGVEYYVREDDNRPNVYVPVFPGYWQTFRSDAPAPVRPPTSEPAQPEDSTASRD